MSEAFKCDRCKEFKGGSPEATAKVTYTTVIPPESFTEEVEEELEFCSGCSKVIEYLEYPEKVKYIDE